MAQVPQQCVDRGRPVLIVFENVASRAQVARLMPRRGTHRAIVTSRNALGPLFAGSYRIALGPLESRDALRLLAAALVDSVTVTRARDDRAETSGRAQIAQLCGGLPLALAIAGSILAGDPALSPLEYAEELRSASSRLSALEYGDVAVRAAFSGSYSRLSAESAEDFRLLSIHPGREISLRSAAALLGVSDADARGRMRKLAHGESRFGRPDVVVACSRSFEVVRVRTAGR